MLAGLANIGLAVAAAYGLGGYLGLLFTPLMCVTSRSSMLNLLFATGLLSTAAPCVVHCRPNHNLSVRDSACQLQSTCERQCLPIIIYL